MLKATKELGGGVGRVGVDNTHQNPRNIETQLFPSHCIVLVLP